jgi:hypothetical protein
MVGLIAYAGLLSLYSASGSTNMPKTSSPMTNYEEHQHGVTPTTYTSTVVEPIIHVMYEFNGLRISVVF